MASQIHLRKGMNKIILFNGPPSSGKDVASLYLFKKYNVLHCSFKRKLIHLTQILLDITPTEWHYWYQDKEKPREELNDLSCRQALIKVSEEMVKPVMGKDFWGRSEANWLKRNLHRDQIAVFSDAGFDEEVVPIVKAFGEKNVHIIKIIREGCSYENDSRKYLSENLLPTENYYTVENNGTLEEFYQNVNNLYDYIIST